MGADSVQALAERWIATKNTARPSPNTVLARQYDLNAVAKLLPAGSMETLPLAEVSFIKLPEDRRCAISPPILLAPLLARDVPTTKELNTGRYWYAARTSSM